MSLTVHHLQVSQSERLPWLCEELSIPYNLVLHQRDPFFSPQSIKDLNPLGQAPIIQDGPITLFESAACAEYINQVYGGGALALKPGHANYADYLYWFHFSNSNLQPLVSLNLQFQSNGVEGAYADKMKARLDTAVRRMDDRLKDNEWLAGKDFTLADIMTVFTLTTMRTFYTWDLSAYENVLAYLGRIVLRDGYKKARAKGDPDLELMIDGKSPVSFKSKLEAEGRL